MINQNLIIGFVCTVVNQMMVNILIMVINIYIKVGIVDNKKAFSVN